MVEIILLITFLILREVMLRIVYDREPMTRPEIMDLWKEADGVVLDFTRLVEKHYGIGE